MNHGVVALEDGIDGISAHARPRKHRLHDDRAGDEAGQDQSGQGGAQGRRRAGGGGADLAYYLVRVVLILRAVNDSLGKITFGVRAIAHRTAPLGELLTPVKVDLEAVADTLESVAAGLDESSAA